MADNDDGWDEIPYPEDAPETFPGESLDASERRAAQGSKAPRIALDDILSKIDHCVFFTGGEAARAFGGTVGFPSSLEVITICLITMANGFTVIGKSAPASPENFDAAKGREFAHEDAIRQLWPLEGYRLCSDLAGKVLSTRSALLTLDDGGETRRFREV